MNNAGKIHNNCTRYPFIVVNQLSRLNSD